MDLWGVGFCGNIIPLGQAFTQTREAEVTGSDPRDLPSIPRFYVARAPSRRADCYSLGEQIVTANVANIQVNYSWYIFQVSVGLISLLGSYFLCFCRPQIQTHEHKEPVQTEL